MSRFPCCYSFYFLLQPQSASINMPVYRDLTLYGHKEIRTSILFSNIEVLKGIRYICVLMYYASFNKCICMCVNEFITFPGAPHSQCSPQKLSALSRRWMSGKHSRWRPPTRAIENQVGNTTGDNGVVDWTVWTRSSQYAQPGRVPSALYAERKPVQTALYDKAWIDNE